ncbi:MAG: glycosyltransferase family 39 protein, partial [Flavobacteriales bacterium]|nr:glycosyltransferase family 39 protein [Flavobacteriales bacterium]
MFNKSTLILIIFCLVNFGAHLGVLDPTLMEARNFITAREMIEDGHIWETTMNGAPRIEKPPFPTWLTALSALVFGRYDNWVMRIPALLMGILMIFWAYQLAIQIFRKHENVKEIAFISAWILSSTVLTIEMSRTGSWDIFYISIATGGFLYLYKGLLKNRMKDYFISGILLGLSFLSKGPAVLAILVAFIIFLWIDLRKQSIPKVSIKKISLLFFVMLSIGAPWFLYNLFFHSELVSNVGSKEAIIWTTKHVKPFYFYLIFPLYMGIWAIPTVIGMIPAFGRRSIDKKYLPLMAWLGINILLMSLMPMKKERYLLSIMVPTALLAGGFLCGISKDVMLRKRVPIISFFPVSIALILAPVGLMLFQESFSIASLEFFGAVLVSFLGIILMRYLLKGKFHHTVYTLG